MSPTSASPNSAAWASRATTWQLRSRTLQFGSLPMLMGIVNVTPDSFSDGGKFFSRQLAVEHALRLEDAGASILDIGGESTRPYSQGVDVHEELARVTPILESLSGRVSAALSIDTSKAAVAEAALALGAEIINDVTGLEGDPQMIEVAVRSQAGVCAMHMQGTPQTMQDDPRYQDVVEDIAAYLAQRDRALLSSGIAAERICLDPGIGFGKTHEHNWALLRSCDRFHSLGRPLLVGHSRKGFIRKLSHDKSGNLTAGSVGVALALALRGVQILRVHDVEATQDALRCFAASGGLDPTELHG
jgi:dihydropteroate synthase